jgi:hypothetical protein
MGQEMRGTSPAHDFARGRGARRGKVFAASVFLLPF